MCSHALNSPLKAAVFGWPRRCEAGSVPEDGPGVLAEGSDILTLSFEHGGKVTSGFHKDGSTLKARNQYPRPTLQSSKGSKPGQRRWSF